MSSSKFGIYLFIKKIPFIPRYIITIIENEVTSFSIITTTPTWLLSIDFDLP